MYSTLAYLHFTTVILIACSTPNKKKSLKMRVSSPGECKVHYFKECILYVAPSTNAEQKVLVTVQNDMQHICAF